MTSTRAKAMMATRKVIHTEPFDVPDRGKTAAGVSNTKQKDKHMSGSIAVAGAALGGGIALGLIGMKAAEAVGRNPGASGKILVQALLSAALAEGAIIIVILMGK